MSDFKAEHRGIWLEVAHVRIGTSKKGGIQLEAQLKGDKADREPVWWIVSPGSSGKPHDGDKDLKDLYRTIAEGIDKKRLVLIQLCPNGKNPGHLHVKYHRIQHSDPAR